MRDLHADELQDRFGDPWTHIDWVASGRALSRMLTDQMNTRCKVLFEVGEQGSGVVYTRIDAREFGSDPASPKVEEIFGSFEWIRFSDHS